MACVRNRHHLLFLVSIQHHHLKGHAIGGFVRRNGLVFGDALRTGSFTNHGRDLSLFGSVHDHRSAGHRIDPNGDILFFCGVVSIESFAMKLQATEVGVEAGLTAGGRADALGSALRDAAAGERAEAASGA